MRAENKWLRGLHYTDMWNRERERRMTDELKEQEERVGEKEIRGVRKS